MAVQKAGKRLVRKTGIQRGRAAADGKKANAAERYGVTKLTVSCGVFVLLVGIKVFLPGQMALIREPMKDMLEKNVDLADSLALLGRAFSEKESTALGELYQAVFGPDTSVAVDSAEDEALLDEFSPRSASEQYVVYTEDNTPERVQLSQEVLGFSYSAPMNGSITSYFGYRAHPTEGEDRFHYGLDITPAEGKDSVAAFADGVVTVVGESSSYGKYLILAHENSCTTLYAHCAGIHVAAGDRVQKGQSIAQAGESGMATGTHLHFELQKGGIYLNPVYYVS